MPKHRQHRIRRRFDDIDRLMAALALYARQQWERVAWGGPDEADEVMEENHRLAEAIMPIVEAALDEDLVEELDNMSQESPFSRWPFPSPRAGFGPAFPFPFPFPPRPFGGFDSYARPHARSYEDDVALGASETFRERLRKAQREGRELTEAEIEELLGDVRRAWLAEARRKAARKSERRRERAPKNPADAN